MLFVENCPTAMSLETSSPANAFHSIKNHHHNEAIASSKNENKDIDFDNNIRSIIPVVPITSDIPALLNKALQFKDN